MIIITAQVTGFHRGGGENFLDKIKTNTNVNLMLCGRNFPCIVAIH